MSRSKFFRKVMTGDRQQDTMQTNIEAAVGQMLRGIIVDGVLLTGVELFFGANKVPHKLQRPARGYIIVSKDHNVNIYDSMATQSADEKSIFLPLNRTDSLTGVTLVSIWVF